MTNQDELTKAYEAGFEEGFRQALPIDPVKHQQWLNEQANSPFATYIKILQKKAAKEQ